MNNRQIGIASSPNCESPDVSLALSLLFSPWSWKKGSAISALEEEFSTKLGSKYAITFESGRVSLFAILKALGLGQGDAVVVQAFTCVVVPNSLQWADVLPIYADIGPDFNIDPKQLENKITSKTKAIVVQHTFGYPADLENIKIIADKYRLKVIEDCAHVIGGKHGQKTLGTIGDVGFYSFGQEKALSSVRGGIVVTDDDELAQRLFQIQSDMSYPSWIEIMRSLLHPILWSIILPLYYTASLGKAILWLAYRLGLTRSLVTQDELSGRKPATTVSRMPAAQARQALLQLKRMEKFNKKRAHLANIYWSELNRVNGLTLPPKTDSPLLRFPILIPDPASLRLFAKKWHIILGNWYDSPIYPSSSNQEAAHYTNGTAKVAEQLSSHVVNLPLNPTMSEADATRVVKTVKRYFEQTNPVKNFLERFFDASRN